MITAKCAGVFYAEVLATADRLVKAARTAGFPPEAAQAGYWPTVCLFWDSGSIEVEVFLECFELYVFPANGADGSFSVSEFKANDSEALNSLLSEITRVRSLGPE